MSKTRIAGGDAFRFLISSATGVSIELDSVTRISTNVWYHLAAVRGPSTMQLFVNGQLERSTNITFVQDYGNFPLYFGSSGQSYWDHKLRGQLDEVSFYNRPLSSNEIGALYAAGTSGKCKAPSLTAQPQNQTLVAGGSATFSVAATGMAPLSYQ